VREIHRRTRRRFSAEEKIRIILEGAGRGEHRGAVPRARAGAESVLPVEQGVCEAGKRLLGDTWSRLLTTNAKISVDNRKVEIVV